MSTRPPEREPRPLRPRGGLQVRCKYAFDRLAAAALTVPLLPVFAAIALAVRLDDGGPAFFVQPRPGLGARPFRCFKFRTMLVDAYRHLDAQGRPTRQRVTRVGRILRWSSLDELPQLFNIMRGEMSFVGPRPPMLDHLANYTSEHMRRFRMKPGVTGLAQIRGRNTLPWSQRIAYDNEYIDGYSLWLDLRILAKTVGVVLRREGIVLDRNPELADDLPKKARSPE